MSVVEVSEALEAPKPIASDERLGHRGPIRRLLVSPEIGALTGAILVWLLFWSVGDQFGTASGFGNTLDVAVPIGIMAVAISLLMIGGEFDLSSGALTGASSVMGALMTRAWLGQGSNIYLALLASLIACAAIGWWNGTMVNKTGLPSFIVTLGTFFVLKGAKLVFAKRLVNKVAIDGAEKSSGFAGLRDVFAGERKYQPFGSRDDIFVALLIAGAAIVAFGLLEQSLRRRQGGLNVKGLAVAVVGAVASGVGFAELLHTDGVGQNTVWGIVSLIGIVLALAGFAQARYETEPLGSFSIPSAILVRVGLGAVVVVAGIVAAYVIDRKQKKVILEFLPSGLRIVTAILGAALGGYFVVKALLPQLRAKFSVGSAVRDVLIVVASMVVAVVATQATLELTTMKALRASLFVGLCATGVLMLIGARSRAARISNGAELVVGAVTALAVFVIALVEQHTSSAKRFRNGLFVALLIVGAILLANALVEALQHKRTTADPSADKVGRLASIGGAVIVGGALIFRLMFSGQSFYIWVLWWIVITVIGSIVLNRTKIGNWIYAVGGNKDAARAIGVPVNRVKVGLFMAVSVAGWFVGSLQLLRFKSVQAQQGDGLEFVFIIAAVVGGNLLTGGYGSVIGAALGAMILAMTTNGVPFARWNSDGQFIFQGALLLAAVLVNNFIRRKAQEAR